MPGRKTRIPKLLIPGAVLAVLVVLCMGSRRAGDFYALHVFPAVSSGLSLVASPFGFSLQTVLIAVFTAAFIWIIVKACRKKQGLLTCLLKEATLLVWIFVWAYSGWCLNYSRSPITSRVETGMEAYDSTAFRSFLAAFTMELNASWVPDTAIGSDEMEEDIKAFYASVPERYGLCSPKGWQHPKRMPLSRFESAMCILGYIGPFFCESHINPDIPANEVPHTVAHECSHLLGVSSEAEANWWAFQCCRLSDIPQMRYSGYLCMLSPVLSNAAGLLSEEDFKEWTATLRQEVKDDFNANQDFWRSRRIAVLDKAQKRIYDLFLKGNNISSGMKNYSESVGLLMTLDYTGAGQPLCGTYRYEGGGFGGDFNITLNEDGTYSYYEGMLSSFIGFGTWTVKDSVLTLRDNAYDAAAVGGNYRQWSTRFRVTEDGDLSWIEDDSGKFMYVHLRDGAMFLR